MSFCKSVVNLWPQLLMTSANHLFFFPFNKCYSVISGCPGNRVKVQLSHINILQPCFSPLSPFSRSIPQFTDKQVLTVLSELEIFLVAENEINFLNLVSDLPLFLTLLLAVPISLWFTWIALLKHFEISYNRIAWNMQPTVAVISAHSCQLMGNFLWWYLYAVLIFKILLLHLLPCQFFPGSCINFARSCI